MMFKGNKHCPRCGTAAAHVATGVDPARLGPPVGDPVRLAWPEVRSVAGSVAGSVVNRGITVNTTSSSVVFSVDGCTISGNNFGLMATGSNAGMLVRHSFITANGTGLSIASSGVILSYRDNSLNNNTTDGAFTGAVALQ
jgi:hypothetical protein